MSNIVYPLNPPYTLNQCNTTGLLPSYYSVTGANRQSERDATENLVATPQVFQDRRGCLQISFQK